MDVDGGWGQNLWCGPKEIENLKIVMKVLSSASGEWKFTTLHLSDSLWLLAVEGCSAQPHLYRILPPRFKRSESLCTCISDVSN